MKKLLHTLILLLCLTSCLMPTDMDQSQNDPTTLPTKICALTSTPEIILSPGIEDTINLLQGPLLLINDNTSSDNPLFLLDVSSAKQYRLEIPDNTSITSLGNALSPDGRSIILTRKFTNDPFRKDLLIYDFMAGTILDEIHIGSSSQINTKEMFSRLPGNVQKELSERNLGNWVLNDSLAGSLGIFRWSADSRSLYFSDACEGGYSCLHSYDLITGQKSQVEREEFFLEGIYLAPDSSSILLIKSPVPQLPDFPMINVVVIDPSLQIKHIPPLPSDLNLNYEYAWLDSNNLVITGFNVEDFTYSEIHKYSLNSNLAYIVENEPFLDFIFLDDEIFILKFDPVTQSSRITIRSDQYQDKTLGIPVECNDLRRSSINGYSVLVFCEQGLFGIDPPFNLIKIADISGNIVFSPDSRFLIQYSPSDPSISNNSIKLLDSNLGLLRELPVPDVRQIIWQPDSLGFLYLSMHGLFRVELPDGEPELLINNNMDDYRHLDAAWFAN